MSKRNSRKNTGYTFAEMLMHIAFLCSLVCIAAPSFSEYLLGNEIFQLRQNLYSSLESARNEAIRVNATVSVCPIAGSGKCGSDWSEGWLSFQDDGRGGGVANDGIINGNERKIATYYGNESNDISVDGYYNDLRVDHVSFNYLGRPAVSGEELKKDMVISVCAKNGVELTRGLLLSQEGFITRTRDYDKDGIEEIRIVRFDGNAIKDNEYGLRCSQ